MAKNTEEPQDAEQGRESCAKTPISIQRPQIIGDGDADRNAKVGTFTSGFPRSSK